MAELTAVKSGAISHVGYDPATETLTVRFTNGGTYSYPGVPEHVHASLMAAESIGKHFYANVRPHYAGTKLEPVAV
jgi:hypothetical protein